MGILVLDATDSSWMFGYSEEQLSLPGTPLYWRLYSSHVTNSQYFSGNTDLIKGIMAVYNGIC